jgi:hypothetical protein
MNDTASGAETARLVSGRRTRSATEAAFRALVEERLHNLETQLAEVKTRLNGLLFFIASTVIAQVLLRLFA